MRASTAPGRRGAGAVVSASLIAMFGALPPFLLGALAVLVRSELGFSEGQLGLAIASSFVAGALGSVACGRLSQRLGARGSILVASAASGVALSGAATAGSYPQLVLWMMAGGLANAFAQVTGNLVLASAVGEGRRGLAFGIKQSALPAATLVAGAGVPLIGVTLGWRWVFGLAAACAASVGLAHVRTGRAAASVAGRRGGGGPAVDRRPLLVLGAGAVFMAAGTMSMAAFLVEYGVSTGVRPGVAGSIQAAASGVGIAFRIVLGWLFDRRLSRDLAVVGVGLGLGALVLAAVPLARGPLGLTVAAVLAFTIGWGWPGVFNLAVVRRYPGVPAIATSVTQVGVYLGSMLGPLAFGLLVEHASFAAAWRMTGASLAVASALILLGRAAAPQP